MEISRLDPSTNIGISQRDEQDYAKKRVQLFNTSSFQTGGFQQDYSALTAGSTNIDTAINAVDAKTTVRLSDGSDLDIPARQSAEKAKADRVYSSMSPDNAGAAKLSASKAAEAAYSVAKAERSILDGDEQGVQAKDIALEAVRAAVVTTVEQVARGIQSNSAAQTGDNSGSAYQTPTPTNMNLSPKELSDGMTQAMTVGMTAVEDKLHELLESFAGKQQMSTEVNTDATELQEMLANWPEGSSQSFTWHEQATDADGNVGLSEKTDTLTKDEATSLLTELQSSATGLDSMGTADQYKLQVAVQDYQQAMSTLSNVMKNYDDDLKSIINNLR